MTGDIFTARFLDCRFDETFFPTLGGDTRKGKVEKEITWSNPSLCHFDHRTKQCDLEVQRIIHLQQIANQLPDKFSDPKRVTKSQVPAENAPIRIDVSEGPLPTNEPKPCLKRGRPMGSKDKNPRKKRGINEQIDRREKGKDSSKKKSFQKKLK